MEFDRKSLISYLIYLAWLACAVLLVAVISCSPGKHGETVELRNQGKVRNFDRQGRKSAGKEKHFSFLISIVGKCQN